MTYICETEKLTKSPENKLRNVKRSIERTITGIKKNVNIEPRTNDDKR